MEQDMHWLGGALSNLKDKTLQVKQDFEVQSIFIKLVFIIIDRYMIGYSNGKVAYTWMV